MKTLTYEQWKAGVLSMPEVKAFMEGNIRVDCQTCDGAGYKVCDMDHEHDCLDCDGRGHFTAEDFSKRLTKRLYEDCVAYELREWDRFAKGEPEKIIGQGFHRGGSHPLTELLLEFTPDEDDEPYIFVGMKIFVHGADA